MLEYLVLYQSESGNTKKIAATIFSHLPGTSKDLIDIMTDKRIPEAHIYFIGFCVHQGSCSMAVSDFLNDLSGKRIALFGTCGMGNLSGKRIALFGTCGMGNSPEYYSAIEHSANVWIESDNEYLGAFICQGKMPQRVRQKYEAIRTKENAAQINLCLRNFDEALTHPDSLDLEHAKVFVEKILKKIEAEEF